MGPRARPGGDLALLPRGVWLETRVGLLCRWARGPVSPSLFAGASLPLPPGGPCRGLLRSVTKPGGALWCVGASQARCGLLSVSAATVRPGGGVVCRRGGSSVPFLRRAPPNPRSGARAPGRGPGLGSSVVGCPATARPPPRWRGARVSARPPPRVSVCAGLLCQPRRDLSGAPSLASRAATGLLGVGARWRGGRVRVLPRLSTPSPALARSRGGGVGQSVTLARCGVGRGPS